LTPVAFVCLVAFVTGVDTPLVALGAALLPVESGSVAALTTLAALATLFGVAVATNSPVSGVAGFATRATFSTFLPEREARFAVSLARFVVAGAESHSVACFAVMGCAFFAIADRFAEDFAGPTETTGSAAFSAATFVAFLAAFGLVAGAFVATGFTA
jgi:hypothetical protein